MFDTERNGSGESIQIAHLAHLAHSADVAFSEIREFEEWARKQLPEEVRLRADIAPVDLGEFKAGEESARLVWGLSQYQHRLVDSSSGQPRLTTWGREKILAVVQNPGDRQVAKPLVYEGDLAELPNELVGGLLSHLEQIREGRVTPSGRLNYWT